MYLLKLLFKNPLKIFKRIKLKPLSLILLFCLSLITTPVIAQINSSPAEQLIQTAKQLYNSQQFNSAIPVWQKALEILPDNSLNEAMALSNLSLTYQQLGQWQEAETAINQSINLLENLEENSEAKSRVLAQSLEIKGLLLYQTGQIQLALETWKNAETIYPDLTTKKINKINQAQAMQDLGLYPRACQTLLETLDLNSQECNINTSDLNKIKTEIINHNTSQYYQNKAEIINHKTNQYYQAKALRSLGNVLRVIGDIQKSKEVLLASLEISDNLGYNQEKSKSRINLGNTERGIALRAEEIGDFTEAENAQKNSFNYYQEAINLTSSSLLKIQAKINQIELLINLDNDLYQNITQENNQNKWQQAEKLLTEINYSLANIPLNRDQIYAQINYAKNYLCIQQQQANCFNPQNRNLSAINEQTLTKTLNILEQALQSAQILPDIHTQSYINGIIGRIYEGNQNWTLAQQYTQQALYDSWQSQARELTYQWQWQEGRILKAQGKNEEALKAYNDSIQTLKSLRSDLVSLNPEIQFSFRESIEPIYRQYVSLLLETDNQSENLQLARKTIDSLQLSELENFFRLVCLDAQPVILDEVTDKNDPTSAIIYPILLENRLEIIFKLPQQPLRHYITWIEDQTELQRVLNRLPLSLTQPNSQETLPLAQQLYDWLLRPLEADLRESEIKTLVFVLDSALRNIPMSVLNDGEKYLIEKYSVALIPSLQLLDPQPFQKIESFALFAGISEARSLNQGQKNFPPLPFVPQEIEEVATKISQSSQLIDNNFTNENFAQAINSLQFSVVHLATHGQFSSQPEETFVLTWNDRLNVNQLNSLIRGRDSKAIELLVLSACETLTGDDRASLGLAGVAIRAGARSTLATLWQVNDQTTSILMNKFYTALSQSQTKAEAIRQAQLSLLNDSNYQRPYFWASYVLVGNWL